MKLWRTPLDAYDRQLPKTKINVIEIRCKGCGLCVEYCPENVLRLSDKFNPKGYHPPEAIDPDNCAGCRFCEEVCPEFAIFLVDQE